MEFFFFLGESIRMVCVYRLALKQTGAVTAAGHVPLLTGSARHRLWALFSVSSGVPGLAKARVLAKKKFRNHLSL